MSVVEAPERGARTEGFNARLVSPSRIDKFLTCGVQFRMKYLEDLPEARSGSAALFGSVLHQALEDWSVDRPGVDLEARVQAAWQSVPRDQAIKDFIAAYQELSVRAIQKEQEIRDKWAAQGKESKAPRMTKDWKESSIAREIGGLWAKWAPKLKDGYYRFSDYDPLPNLYDESLVVARRYRERWGHLPNVLFTEFELNEPWRDYTIRAYVDAIEPVVNQAGEVYALAITDYKSYSQVPAALKDWRQVVMYDAAVRAVVARGGIDLGGFQDLPLLVCIDYLRWTDSWKKEDGSEFPSRRYWAVTEADHERLFRELEMYRTSVEAGIFLPANKGQKADFCDYPENCCLRNCNAAGGGIIEVEVRH